MVFSPRVSLNELANLSQRLATMLEAGVDMRTIWDREAERPTGAARRQYHAIRNAVHAGTSLAEAVEECGAFFPLVFREMVAVGEKTGHLSEVFAQLAEHYRQAISMRRAFLAAIAWPMIQLTAAAVIIGLLIWAMGIVSAMTGTEVDVLGFGLVGAPGLLVYFAFLGLCVGALWLLIAAARRGVLWAQPIQRVVLRLPGLGPALETLALARVAWVMHLTMKAGMEVRRALEISLRASRNARYLDQIDSIDRDITAGNSIYEAFSATGAFPVEFLDTIRVGEQSGRIVESMQILSRQYDERARYAMATITTIAGFLVWALVALLIILLIFRLAAFYIGAIHGATEL